MCVCIYRLSTFYIVYLSDNEVHLGIVETLRKCSQLKHSLIIHNNFFFPDFDASL